MTEPLLVYADGAPVAVNIDASALLVYADGAPAGVVPFTGGGGPAAFPLQLLQRRGAFGTFGDRRVAHYVARRDDHGES